MPNTKVLKILKDKNFTEIYTTLALQAQKDNIKYMVSRDPHKIIAKESFFNTGHLVKVDENILKLRRRVGLSERPPTTLKHKKAVEEIRFIIIKTGFDKIIGM